MKTFGIVLAVVLLCSMVVMPSVDAKQISKNQIKKDIKITDSKSVSITKISKSRTLHVWNIVTVQVCAGLERLYSPDLEIKSDRDTIQVTMWGLIMPKTCKSGEFFIAANDPSTISVGFSSQKFVEPAK